MKNNRCFRVSWTLTILILFLTMPVFSLAKEIVQEWELINPQGIIKIEPIKLAPRITTLEGKTVLLRWNGKPNGDRFLNRVAELLTKQVKSVKIIKMWEFDSSTVVNTSLTPLPLKVSKEIAQKIAKLKPDIVIGSQCD